MNGFDSLIYIPKNMESELLGSLLQDIQLDGTSKNHFPEAHGEWTKQLFPYHHKLNPEKDSTLLKQWNAVSIPQASNLVGKVEHSFNSETGVLPIQFYKSVPPPLIASRFQPPYMHCQPSNRKVYPNILISNPPSQQVKFKVTVPVSSIPPAAYISQSSMHQSCNVLQGISPAIHGVVANQFHKLNNLRAPYQYCISQDITESQKHQSNIDDNFCLEKNSIKNKANNLSKEQLVSNNVQTRTLPNIPKTATTPYVKLNHGYNFPFRIQQNVGKAIINSNTAPKSVISNPQLKAPEPRLALNRDYPITSYRLRTPLITSTPSPRKHYIMPQFTSKPRFLGPITVNHIKQMQERLFQQRCYINSPLSQNVKKTLSYENIQLHLKDANPGYEDKVEKWLESVHEYVKSGLYINLREPDDPNTKLSDNCSQLHDVEKDESTELVRWQNENESKNCEAKSTCDEIKSFSNTSPITINGNFHENKANILKFKKLKAKRLFFEHLRLFREIMEKIKKCKTQRRKMMIIKKYITQIYSANPKKFHFESLIKVIRKNNLCIKKVGQLKEKEFSESKQKCCELNKQFSTKSNFDMYQSNWFINDIGKYKTYIRENPEYNTLPSKRMKLRKTLPSCFETETLIRHEHSRKISSLKYYNSIIDNLLFAMDGIVGINDAYQNKMVEKEVNGWSHFKVAIKTVMKNIISSLDMQN